MATIDRGALAGAGDAERARSAIQVPWDRLVLVLLAAAVLYPLWEIVQTSLLEPAEVLARDVAFWPPSFAAYERAWTGIPFPRYMLNSFIVTTLVTIGTTFTAILGAYAFARARFPGRDLLFLLAIGTLMIPSHITLIPNYLTFARLHLLDTFVCLILPFLASGFSIFFLRQHMLTIPTSLDEAARMDGASTWMILWTIIVPLSWPAIAVVSLFAFMSNWNEFVWPLLATTSENMRTVQIGLRYLVRDEEVGGTPDWPLVMAGTLITLLPLLLAYLVTERHLIRGITMGSFR